MRRPGTAAGVLLVLIFVCSLPAAAVVIDKTDFMLSTETKLLTIGMMEKLRFKALPPKFEFLALFNTPALDTLRGNEFIGDLLPESVFFKYRRNPIIYAANVPGARADSPDLDHSSLEMSDEPIPKVAVLVLVGLVAFIALNRRRK